MTNFLITKLLTSYSLNCIRGTSHSPAVILNISTSLITCGQITCVAHVKLLKEIVLPKSKKKNFRRHFDCFCPYNEGQWGPIVFVLQHIF